MAYSQQFTMVLTLRWILFLLLFIHFFGASVAVKRHTGRCVPAIGAVGFCVPLKHCPLARLTGRSFLMKLYNALSDFACGFSNGSFHVCCPTESSAKSLSLPLKTPVVLDVPVKKNSPGRKAEPNKMNHPNRKFLQESSCGVQLADKILGGTKMGLEEHPWLARLRTSKDSRFSNQFICGGSLISPRYVLSAAHCKIDYRITAIDLVRLGEYDSTKMIDCTTIVGHNKQCSPPPDDVPVQKVYIHPEYRTGGLITHDIALIQLQRPAKLSAYVQPICLPLDDLQNANYNNEKLWTAGWGKTSNEVGSSSPVKMKVELPYVPFAQCSAIYNKKFHVQLIPPLICVGGEKGRDSCLGDSGGPLMKLGRINNVMRWYLVAVVGQGPRDCGTTGSPGLYTSVAHHLKWILDNITE